MPAAQSQLTNREHWAQHWLKVWLSLVRFGLDIVLSPWCAAREAWRAGGGDHRPSTPGASSGKGLFEAREVQGPTLTASPSAVTSLRPRSARLADRPPLRRAVMKMVGGTQRAAASAGAVDHLEAHYHDLANYSLGGDLWRYGDRA